MVPNMREVALTRPFDETTKEVFKDGFQEVGNALAKFQESSKEALQLHWEKIIGHKFQIVVSLTTTLIIWLTESPKSCLVNL